MQLQGMRMVPRCPKTWALCYVMVELPLLIASLSRHVSRFAKHTQRSELRQSRHREWNFCVQEAGSKCLSFTLAKRWMLYARTESRVTAFNHLSTQVSYDCLRGTFRCLRGGLMFRVPISGSTKWLCRM